MLPQTTADLKYFCDPRLTELGITHAFTCRSGDKQETLDRLVARVTAPFKLAHIMLVKQVHETDVLDFDGDSTDANSFRSSPFDAIVTSRPGVAVGVRTADCVPILIAAPGKAVAAVHGGWRCILGGIIGNTVSKMTKKYNAEPSQMFASIGPHIRSCCFEVGLEVAGPFVERFGKEVLTPGKRDRPHLSLETVARIALQKEGVPAKNIGASDRCTCCAPELFYSYRRDGKPTGRQISFIVMGARNS